LEGLIRRFCHRLPLCFLIISHNLHIRLVELQFGSEQLERLVEHLIDGGRAADPDAFHLARERQELRLDEVWGPAGQFGAICDRKANDSLEVALAKLLVDLLQLLYNVKSDGLVAILE